MPKCIPFAPLWFETFPHVYLISYPTAAVDTFPCMLSRRETCANSSRLSAMTAPPNSSKGSSLRQKPFSFPARSRQIAKQKSWTRTSYFDARQQKLIAQAPRAETDILRGVVVYFTGVKSISQRKLEAVVWRNGGVVDKLWRRQQVTHIIADNLAASKVQKEIDASPADRSVVVSPKWILQSVERGERLPTWDFRVIKGIPGVKNIAGFFQKAKQKPLSKTSSSP